MVETSDEEKRKRFLAKHQPLEEGSIVDEKTRPKTVSDAWAEQERIRQQYSTDMTGIEQNLTEFLTIEDPLVYQGKVLAWIKRPSNKELRALVPPEMRKYAKNPSDIPDELLDKYDDEIVGVLAKLITRPKWSAEEWKTKMNPWFTRLFWEHIGYITNLAQVELEGF